jgi:hypothetical protein
MLRGNVSPDARLSRHTIMLCVAFATVALMLAGGSMRATAQDVLSSDGSNTGQWNPGREQAARIHTRRGDPSDDFSQVSCQNSRLARPCRVGRPVIGPAPCAKVPVQRGREAVDRYV